MARHMERLRIVGFLEKIKVLGELLLGNFFVPFQSFSPYVLTVEFGDEF